MSGITVSGCWNIIIRDIIKPRFVVHQADRMWSYSQLYYRE